MPSASVAMTTARPRSQITITRLRSQRSIITPIDHNNPGDNFYETIKILKH